MYTWTLHRDTCDELGIAGFEVRFVYMYEFRYGRKRGLFLPLESGRLSGEE